MICFTAFDNDSDSDEDEQPIIPEQLDSQLEDSQHADPSAHDPVSYCPAQNGQYLVLPVASVV